MSWSGFKKAAGRATTQVMMKTGQTTDREYEVEERRYRTLESASLRLQKEAKGYLDSLRAMTASQMRIAETIDAFYGESGARDGVSRSYKQAVEDLDAETVKALDGPYRCVPSDLYDCVFDEEKGMYGKDVVEEVEREWNFRSKRRLYTIDRRTLEDGVGFEGAIKLMDFVYRTTVLEPINRFCAYFPDVNECIKKRNHKMLDYDAMRSKVKKLVEKPDKDPSKLPRTEKETEMVSMTDFLRDSPSNTPLQSKAADDDTAIPDVDLSVPSPPKILDNIKRIHQLQQEDEELVRRHSGLGGMRRNPSIMSRVSGRRKSLRSSSGGLEEALLQRSPSLSSHPASFVGTPQVNDHLPMVRESSTEALLHPYQPKSRTFSGTPSGSKRTSRGHLKDITNTSSIQSADDIALGQMKKRKSDPRTRARTPTPFFQPSELEDIMAPLREEYVKTQTDTLAQAKAAYEQLNEQLTNELPQLIDLRVPYLDPSFEALVKIQLRFCAEAYSRMAQVQQYLDASTRDQYASGDLDARVEDVLGQIRELSIAGTV